MEEGRVREKDGGRECEKEGERGESGEGATWG